MFSHLYKPFPRPSCVFFPFCLLTVFSRFLQASLNFDNPTLKSLLKALPESPPAMAQRQCLQRGGLYDGEDNDKNLSYDYDSYDGDKH